ncbi:molybdenum ABC transporter ATP-binding protein [Pseudoroseicyclus tamaricis]|uniref:Molybdenum ABC transporter ATP-binding protein n=1 Tax=Pseudoroseicyclus tamaricis TaxID=2705421 RepID=A0A6B2JSC7_9RHOB|nr:molybdenum ABC transporter ATP-binding protein [Pseudoroseicyclus tamaricis]NDV01128.1 molybdenum ABC transporter ATP-binding protein [Pseudoroseicyclus tamaricis]
MTLSVALRHRLSPAFALEVAFDAPPGVTALFGRSGAGKSSILRAVAGLIRPDEGRITVDGAPVFDSAAGIDLPPHRRRFGLVFQEPRLFPHLSVARNLRYGRRALGLPAAPAREAEIVEMLGIGALLSRRPSGLSGGEAARVAIGRALLTEPRLLMLDEPFASLDAARREEILPYLERLRDHAGLPILFVSHALPEVARLAARIVVLGDGHVLRAGPAAEMLADPEAAELLGPREAGAVLTGTVGATAEDGLTEVHLPGGTLHLPGVTAGEGARIPVRIAASDVILALEPPRGLSALNMLRCRVASLHRGKGPGVMVGLTCGPDALLARVTARSAEAMGLAEGLEVTAIVKSVAIGPADLGGG